MKSSAVEIDVKAEAVIAAGAQQFSWKPDEELVNHLRRALQARFENIVPCSDKRKNA